MNEKREFNNSYELIEKIEKKMQRKDGFFVDDRYLKKSRLDSYATQPIQFNFIADFLKENTKNNKLKLNIQSHSQLTKLSAKIYGKEQISLSFFQNIFINYLIQYLKKHPEITQLSCDSEWITDGEKFNLVAKTNCLINFTFHPSEADEEILKSIRTNSVRINKLHFQQDSTDSLRSEDFQFFATHPYLKMLTFFDRTINSADIKTIASSKSIQHLDLDDCGISDEDVNELAKMQLITLSLPCNKITARSIKTLLTNSHLKKLNLTANNIGDEGAAVIATAFQSGKCTIESLRLGDCGLSYKGALEIVKAVKSDKNSLIVLNFLDIDNEPEEKTIGKKGCELIAEAMKSNTSIIIEGLQSQFIELINKRNTLIYQFPEHVNLIKSVCQDKELYNPNYNDELSLNESENDHLILPEYLKEFINSVDNFMYTRNIENNSRKFEVNYSDFACTLFKKQLDQGDSIEDILIILSESLIEIELVPASLLHKMGREFLKIEKYKEAEECFNKALSLSNANEVIKCVSNIVSLIEAKVKQEKPIEQSLEQFINLSNTTEKPDQIISMEWMYLGDLLRNIGKNKEAELCFKEALVLADEGQAMDILTIRAYLIDVQLEQNKLIDNALEEFLNLVPTVKNSDEKLVEHLNFLGKTFYSNKKYKEAERCFGVAVNLTNSTDVKSCVMQIKAQLEQNKILEQDIEQCLSLVRTNWLPGMTADEVYDLGCMLYDIEKYKEAELCFTQTLKPSTEVHLGDAISMQFNFERIDEAAEHYFMAYQSALKKEDYKVVCSVLDSLEDHYFRSYQPSQFYIESIHLTVSAADLPQL
ncbi:MAG: hypothetical protein H0T84_15500 [Tatlockia sp.]|nr:hypothetical protein [Tatlockia sp.]